MVVKIGPRTFLAAHPVIDILMGMLRNKETVSDDFRRLVQSITNYVGLMATSLDLPIEEIEVATPVGVAGGHVFSGQPPVIVPIIRAGLEMVAPMRDILPNAIVGHLGLARDEKTLEPAEYYAKLPDDLDGRIVFLVDPMLATGGSASHAISYLISRGATDIRLICLIAAQPGIDKLLDRYQDLRIFCAAIDPELNANGYIVPGLGDAGDRINGW